MRFYNMEELQAVLQFQNGRLLMRGPHFSSRIVYPILRDFKSSIAVLDAIFFISNLITYAATPPD